jgi:3-isopropylmalate dehydrogenase
VGGAGIDNHGQALPESTLKVCAAADAILFGSVGGPKWEKLPPKEQPERAALLPLRKHFTLFANIRPGLLYRELTDASPLKTERIPDGIDIVCIRELTGGLYFGKRGRERTEDGGERAFDTMTYSDGEIRRVVELAFRLAAGRRKAVTSVDKANVLESSRLWRQVAVEVAARHPGITLEHQLVDSAAMRIIVAPAGFDVVVTENMFGDILTDEAAVLAGSLGLLPSASLGEGRFGLYEPIHGSAPDIAGRGLANPIGTVLSAAMLLRHSLELEAEAAAVEAAVDQALATGARTADLGGALGTGAMVEAITAGL